MSSTEFLVLEPRADVSLGAVWLGVRDQAFVGELVRRATGTSGSHQRVRPADAMAMEVPDARSAPAATVAMAEALLTLSRQRRVESRRLASLRDALLPELLSGRIRVPEAREAVESVG